MHVRALFPFMLAAALLTEAAYPQAVCPCSMCGQINQKTLRQEAHQSQIVVCGTLANARLVGDTKGTTDLILDTIIKTDPAIKGLNTLTIPQWMPLDPKAPLRILIYSDIDNGKLVISRGITLKEKSLVDYLRGGLTLDEHDRNKLLAYYFQYLDSPDPTVAADAFLEFAKTPDAELSRAAKKFAPAKLRKMLKDPATPPERIGVLAYLLGASGGPEDAALLSELIARRDDQPQRALSGLLAGLLELQPRTGWDLARRILEDPRQQITRKIAVLGTMRFMQASRGPENKTAILQLLGILLAGRPRGYGGGRPSPLGMVGPDQQCVGAIRQADPLRPAGPKSDPALCPELSPAGGCGIRETSANDAGRGSAGSRGIAGTR